MLEPPSVNPVDTKSIVTKKSATTTRYELQILMLVNKPSRWRLQM